MSLTLDDFLDQELQDSFKGLVDTHKSLAATVKKVLNSAAVGELESLTQALERYQELLMRQNEWVRQLKESAPAFNVQEYLQEQFHKGFLEALAEEELPVEANYPVYEIFPFKVRVVPEQGLVKINDKIKRTLRPKALARYLKQEIRRLNSLPFNGPRFLHALARAYDTKIHILTVTHKIELNEQEVLLKEIYNLLTPLPHQKKEYPLQMFAFDLHRLLKDNCTLTGDGRRLWIGNVRKNQQAMLILNAQGVPQRYGVIKFFREV